jgi:hypothetical protein
MIGRAIFAIYAVITSTPSESAWTFTTLDAPLAYHSTSATDIDGDHIVGIYLDSSGKNHGFLYDGSSYQTLDHPSAAGQGTNPLGISGTNIVGTYYPYPSVPYGFLYDGTSWTTIKHPMGVTTCLLAVSGPFILGYYKDSWTQPRAYAFLYDGSSYTPLDNIWSTGMSGGRIVGYKSDSSGFHGFVYDGSSYRTLDHPLGAKGTWIHDIDGLNMVGAYIDSSGKGHGFLYDGSSWTTIDHPLAVHGGWASGISGSRIVGRYDDSQGHTHGYVATTAFKPYELIITSSEGGSVTIPGEGSFTSFLRDQETTISLKATAKPGYCFMNWTETAVDAGKVADPKMASTTMIFNGDYVLRANFTSADSPPSSPTLTSPANGAGAMPAPAFCLSASDPCGDRLKFKIELLKGDVVIRTFDQSQSADGWDKVDYASDEVATLAMPGGQTLARGMYQWRGYAFDGSRWGPPSETWSFCVKDASPACFQIHDTTILYTELEDRPDYSILVPSTTAPGAWREMYIFGVLDVYGVRVQRYRDAFVAAMMQPELTRRLLLSGDLQASLRDAAADVSAVAGMGDKLSNLASILVSGRGVFDVDPTSIQTTLLNWQNVVENRPLSESLGKLSLSLKGVAFVAHISADVLNDIFMHAVTNAMVLERMDALDRFFGDTIVPDFAMVEGFELAKEDVTRFITEDVSLIQSTLNTFESNGPEYIVEGSAFLPAIAKEYLVSTVWAGTIKRLVLPVYLSYNIAMDLSADMVDLQSMCAAATLNEMLLDWMFELEFSMPDISDPSYETSRRLFLTTAQMRYGLGYWYNAKYDQILELNLLKPMDLIQWFVGVVQWILSSYPDVDAFRQDVLQRWMDDNFIFSKELSPCLSYEVQSELACGTNDAFPGQD